MAWPARGTPGRSSAKIVTRLLAQRPEKHEERIGVSESTPITKSVVPDKTVRSSGRVREPKGSITAEKIGKKKSSFSREFHSKPQIFNQPNENVIHSQKVLGTCGVIRFAPEILWIFLYLAFRTLDRVSHFRSRRRLSLGTSCRGRRKARDNTTDRRARRRSKIPGSRGTREALL